jgi:hypothetical protein
MAVNEYVRRANNHGRVNGQQGKVASTVHVPAPEEVGPAVRPAVRKRIVKIRICSSGRQLVSVKIQLS